MERAVHAYAVLSIMLNPACFASVFVKADCALEEN